MCLRNNRLAWLMCGVLLLTITTSASARDDISTYLEQRGLRQLLVIYLEQQLESPSLATEQRQLERCAAELNREEHLQE